MHLESEHLIGAALVDRLQAHFALFSELDGVADQVGENLLHPDHVALDVAFSRLGHLQLKRHALVLGAHGEQRHHAAHGLAEVEGLDLDVDLAGLDAGEVQHVRQQPLEGDAGGPDQLDHVALVGGQGGAREHVRHPHHPVQRGADLMAHIGQEGALGLVGRLGLLGRRPQHRRRRPFLCDVLGHADQVARALVAVGGHLAGAEITQAGIDDGDRGLLDADLSREHHLGFGFLQARGLGIGEEFGVCAADHLVARPAEQFLGGEIEQDIAPVAGVLGEQDRGHIFDDRVQHRLGFDLLGHVARDRDHPHRAAIVARRRSDPGVPPAWRAGIFVLEGAQAGGFAALGRFDRPVDLGLVLFGPEVSPAEPGDLGLADAGHLQRPGIGVLDPAVQVQDCDAVVARLQQALEQRALGAQRAMAPFRREVVGHLVFPASLRSTDHGAGG